MSNIQTWKDMGKGEYQISPFKIEDIINQKVCLMRGDITKIFGIDCLVNAANSGLYGGGGVDGAIHRAAGSKLHKYLKQHYNQCETGDFKPSPGFDIPCEEILHGVGPMGKKPDLLQLVYLRCLMYMKHKNYHTIAFPCISTGIYDYPNKDACETVLQTLRFWLENNPDWNGYIVICCYEEKDYNIYRGRMGYYFPTNRMVTKGNKDDIKEYLTNQSTRQENLSNEMKEMIEKNDFDEIQRIGIEIKQICDEIQQFLKQINEDNEFDYEKNKIIRDREQFQLLQQKEMKRMNELYPLE